MKALGGQRHEIFRVHDFQWESMGSGNGAVKKKIQNSSNWPLIADKMSASIYGSHEV